MRQIRLGLRLATAVPTPTPSSSPARTHTMSGTRTMPMQPSGCAATTVSNCCDPNSGTCRSANRLSLTGTRSVKVPQVSETTCFDSARVVRATIVWDIYSADPQLLTNRSQSIWQAPARSRVSAASPAAWSRTGCCLKKRPATRPPRRHPQSARWSPTWSRKDG